MKFESGKHISFLFEDKELQGTILTEQGSKVTIKLDSGYNMSLKSSEMKEIKELKIKAKESVLKTASRSNTKLPKISILHTGGTIASKVDYRTGGVISRYTAEEIVAMFPELEKLAYVSSRLMRNMWSEDMRFAHYNLMAEEIKKEIENGAQGIIVTHGTDTMHYSSAALSFALKNLPVPVMLVGAQRSSDRGSGDGAQNMLAAVRFMLETDFCDVGICMHETSDDEWCSILPGTKVRKMHSSRRDAFKAINTTPWARVHKSGTIEILNNSFARRGRKGFEVLAFKENLKVGLVKVHTNMYASQFEAYRGFKGLLIEGMGIAGHIPINEIDNETKENAKIKSVISELIKGGTLIAAATQTIYGRVNMNVYTTGRDMQQMGIMGHLCDMTAETAFIKLAWLLSNYDKQEVKELYMKNLRGEITVRTEENAFDI